jgi:tetratricopeptide (TPR) repeat protein
LVTNVRIAQTLQFLKRFEESEKLYLKLEDEIHRNRELKNLLHFVFQHRGKLLFDQNRFSESILQFEKALELRVQLGNQELIESTLFAIELTKRKLSE